MKKRAAEKSHDFGLTEKQQRFIKQAFETSVTQIIATTASYIPLYQQRYSPRKAVTNACDFTSYALHFLFTNREQYWDQQYPIETRFSQRYPAIYEALTVVRNLSRVTYHRNTDEFREFSKLGPIADDADPPGFIRALGRGILEKTFRFPLLFDLQTEHQFRETLTDYVLPVGAPPRSLKNQTIEYQSRRPWKELMQDIRFLPNELRQPILLKKIFPTLSDPHLHKTPLLLRMDFLIELQTLNAVFDKRVPVQYHEVVSRILDSIPDPFREIEKESQQKKEHHKHKRKRRHRKRRHTAPPGKAHNELSQSAPPLASHEEEEKGKPTPEPTPSETEEISEATSAHDSERAQEERIAAQYGVSPRGQESSTQSHREPKSHASRTKRRSRHTHGSRTAR